MLTPKPHALQKGRSSSESSTSSELNADSGWEASCFLSCCRSHWYNSSYISLSRSQIGSAFIRMNSSTSMPSILGGLLIRFCFPLTNMVMCSFLIRFFSALWAGKSFVSSCAFFSLRPFLRHSAAHHQGRDREMCS
jgi:hypothetical protein